MELERPAPKFGMIDINCNHFTGDNNDVDYYITSYTSHVNGPDTDGDESPEPFAGSTEHPTKHDAQQCAVSTAQRLLLFNFAGRVTIFVDGNEFQSYTLDDLALVPPKSKKRRRQHEDDPRPKKHTLPPARFGFSEEHGEDDHDGDMWFKIGALEADGTIEDEYAVVLVGNQAESERAYPGITEQRRRYAQIIAEALTEYGDNHGFGAGWFYH